MGFVDFHGTWPFSSIINTSRNLERLMLFWFGASIINSTAWHCMHRTKRTTGAPNSGDCSSTVPPCMQIFIITEVIGWVSEIAGSECPRDYVRSLPRWESFKQQGGPRSSSNCLESNSCGWFTKDETDTVIPHCDGRLPMCKWPTTCFSEPINNVQPNSRDDSSHGYISWLQRLSTFQASHPISVGENPDWSSKGGGAFKPLLTLSNTLVRNLVVTKFTQPRPLVTIFLADKSLHYTQYGG